VNGTQVGTLTTTSPLPVTTGQIILGGDPWGQYFQGRIDNVRIYNRALSAAEILTDSNTPIP
jgi:hypothetical protein